MNPKFIELFNSALCINAKSETPMDPKLVNELSIKCGYIVRPVCCTKAVYDYFKEYKWNPNSTFYKTWDDIVSKSREELFIDQIIHYASTYGTDFEGIAYTKNPDPIEIDYKTYTFINPISEQQLYDKCMSMICSGAALKSDLVKILCDYVVSFDVNSINIDDIKNREAQIYLIDHTNKYPNNADIFFKYIVYKTTGETMVIKNRDMIDKIQNNAHNFRFTTLNDEQLRLLSEVFYRYKPLFLAFKATSSNRNPINRIRRYAKKYHKPTEIGFWENILSKPHSENRIKEEAKKLDNNFKIIKLLQAIRERLLIMQNGGDSLYIIRNGKVYKKNKQYSTDFISQLDITYNILLDRLIDNLKKKACVVKFPQNLNLTCPVSEKQFVGNIPFGSSYDMDKHNFIGIYWRNEWGAYDFDLSYIDMDGNKIGWNTNFYDNIGVVYSGDMTNADPEATEILYCEKSCPDGSILVSRFNGDPNSTFKLFFGTQCINKLTKNYMVDPNNIKFETLINSKEFAQQTIGYIRDNRVYFVDFSTSKSQVSFDDLLSDIIDRKIKTYIDLKPILLAAGFEEFDDKKHESCDLDLTILDKNSLISIFS